MTRRTGGGTRPAFVPYRPILCGFDDSAPAARAAEFAGELAGRLAVALVLLSVVDAHQAVVPTAPAAMPVVIEPPDLLERHHDAARERAEQVTEQLGPLARTRAMVEVGDPAGQIEQAGRELDAALILVGTHQRSTLAAALAGSHVTGADDGNASGADRALTARVFQLDRSLIRS